MEIKNEIFIKVFIWSLLFLPLKIYTQDNTGNIHIGNTVIHTEGRPSAYPVKVEYYNADQFLTVKDTVKKIITDYQKKGKLKFSEEDIKFILPIRPSEPLEDQGFYSISAYYDHDLMYPGKLKDFNCSNLTYDTDNGYNHTGTDFFPWPFPWLKMMESEVEIIAAAKGILIYKQDGNFDQHCEVNDEAWNGVGILHENGLTSWYIHMKKNSLTVKNVGDTLNQGEFLGIVGSSGNSLAPHLHFEVLDMAGNPIDPFIGTCNPDITESWWEEQLPYAESGVNKICTNSHLPVLPGCPNEEIPNETNEFYPGDSIFLLSYFRNISPGDLLEVEIRRPDQSLFAEWLWENPHEFNTAAWVYFLMFLDDQNYGEWKYSLSFKGIAYDYIFKLKSSPGIKEKNSLADTKVYPVPASNEIFVFLPQDITSEIDYIIKDLSGHTLITGCHAEFCKNQLRIDLSDLKKGIYFLTIKMQMSAECRKIIKL